MKMTNRQFDQFLDRFGALTQERKLIRLVLSNRRAAASDLKSVTVTPIEIRKGYRLNFVFRHLTRDITQNFDPAEGSARIRELLENDFLNADLIAPGESVRLLVLPSGKVKLRTGSNNLAPAVSLSHDHKKERNVLQEGNRYLQELGVLDANFAVRPAMRDKFLQIDRYIGLLAPVAAELALPGPIRVADMGSGKGYLTFALYDHLARTTGKEILMTGVEARKELVEQSNRIAAAAGFGGLSFTAGTILDATFDNPDILIALHACDTATDDAIARGIRAGSALIVCAPCCQKQVRKDMAPAATLKGVLKHGILMERQAELLTDGIRSLLLEASVYKTSVMEFIATEHTPKNVLITARKAAIPAATRAKSLATARQLMDLFGIRRHRLMELLDLK